MQDVGRIRFKRMLWGISTLAFFVIGHLLLVSPPSSPFPVSVYTDTEKGRSLSDVLALAPSSWQEVRPDKLSYLAQNGREVWLHVHMDRAAVAARWVAEIMTPHLRQVDFYLMTGGHIVESSFQGMDRPFTNRPYHYMYQAFGFTQQAAVDYELYVRAYSEITVYLPLQILVEDAFNSEVVTRNMVLGLLFGIFAGIVLYNLCFCVSLRDRAYLYYCIFEIGVVVLGVVWSGEAHLLNNYLATHFVAGFRIMAATLGFISIFFALFIQEFAELKYTDAAANRLILPFISLMVPATLVAQLLPVHLLLELVIGCTLVGASALMVGLTIRAKTQRESYILLSFLGLGCCVVIQLITTNAWIPGSTISQYVLPFGGVWEALFFSLALSDRIKVMRNERQAIISSLKGEAPVSELNGILGSTFHKTVGLNEMNVTIMFIDIVGFSQTSDLLGSHEVFKYLSRLMRDISTIVRACHGTVDRSLGDGVLCFFGYERGVRLHHHAQDAFQAAKQIQEHIVTHFQTDAHVDEFILPVRIGIHVADVLIGDLGGVQKIDFTMIGSGVNFASRLETACSPFKIMVSEECYRHLGRAQGDGFSEIMVALKHQEQLVKAYEYNPFTATPTELERVEKLHLEQLNLKPHECRYEITSDRPIHLKSSQGIFRVLDFSSHGFRVISDSYVGRKATLLVDLTTFDDTTNDVFRAALLHSFYVEVRWSRSVVGGFEHGLRIYGLNGEQRLQIFNGLEALFQPQQLNRLFENLQVAS